MDDRALLQFCDETRMHILAADGDPSHQKQDKTANVAFFFWTLFLVVWATRRHYWKLVKPGHATVARTN